MVETEDAPPVLADVEFREAQEAVAQKLSGAFSAIERCLTAGLWEPTLVLLYATIDAMAWLDRPPGQPDVTADDFISWTKRYVDPESTIGCSAETCTEHAVVCCTVTPASPGGIASSR